MITLQTTKKNRRKTLVANISRKILVVNTSNKSQRTPPLQEKKTKIKSKSELKLEEWPTLYKKFSIAQKANITIAKTM